MVNSWPFWPPTQKALKQAHMVCKAGVGRQACTGVGVAKSEGERGSRARGRGGGRQSAPRRGPRVVQGEEKDELTRRHRECPSKYSTTLHAM